MVRTTGAGTRAGPTVRIAGTAATGATASYK